MKEKIVYKDGTHRILLPEETLAMAMPHMSAMGITRIADVTGLDTIDVPVVMVTRPNSRSVSVSQGKGHSLAAAKASGLMESIEGWHAENIELPVRTETFASLVNVVDVVSLDSMPPYGERQLSDALPITWIESQELNSNRLVWLPYEMVHTRYTDPRPAGYGYFPASSNGLASGNSTTEATVHGICEVIERDAISLWHQFGDSAVDATSINANTIHDPLCVQTLDKLQHASQDSYIWDITADNGIPTYFVVIVDRNSHTKHIGVGSGTHLCRHVALLRALHEAVQVRTTYIVGARDDITLDEYTDAGIEAKHQFFRRLIDVSSFEQSFGRRRDLDCETVDLDLLTLLNRLRLTNVEEVYCVNLTRPELDIPVVRVVIPGLESPHDDTEYLPGPRAIRAKAVFGR